MRDVCYIWRKFWRYFLIFINKDIWIEIENVFIQDTNTDLQEYHKEGNREFPHKKICRCKVLWRVLQILDMTFHLRSHIFNVLWLKDSATPFLFSVKTLCQLMQGHHKVYPTHTGSFTVAKRVTWRVLHRNVTCVTHLLIHGDPVDQVSGETL